MPRERSLYTTPDLELLKCNLNGILTRTPEEISHLARDKFPEEVVSLAEIFKSMSDSLHHKWYSAVLAKLPPEALQENHSGKFYIDVQNEAALRFLSSSTLDMLPELSKQVIQARKHLYEELVNGMSVSQKRVYKEMLTYTTASEFDDNLSTKFPLNFDTVFGHRLSILESLMNTLVKQLVSNWVEQNDWPSNETVPSDVSIDCSEYAMNRLMRNIEQWFGESKNHSDIPDSLLALTSANLSANRILLEQAAIDALGIESSKMIVEFLSELNQIGINEVPIEVEGLEEDDARIKLYEIFTSWFGHSGFASKKSDFFKRRMNKSDLAVVLDWGQKLQDRYIISRGIKGGPEIHGGSSHFFIFSLAVIAAFYCKTKVEREFKGHSNSKYAVFPDRKKHSECETQSIPPHAEQILLQAYGQIYFANSGWDLFSEKVRQYAETASIKRSHIQILTFYATKYRSSSELFMLYNKLDPVKWGVKG